MPEHNTLPEEQTVDTPVNPLALDRALVETTIPIEEGETGYSYQLLFLPYLAGAKQVTVIDPYIRMGHQIKNFIDFCALLEPDNDTIAIHLVTGSDDAYQQDKQMEAFEDLQTDLSQHRITFTYEFDQNVHKRVLETDTGWRIKPERGLDFFQKPESWYSLGGADQTKRKCRQTEIDYRKME